MRRVVSAPSTHRRGPIIAALVLIAARPVGAQDRPATTRPPTGAGARPTPSTTTASGDTVDYTTPRYEPAGFPLIGGSTDIGVLVGGAGTLSRFQNGVRPYFWNMDLVLAASFKSGPSGVEVAQQNYRWQLDLPGLAGGRLRLHLAAFFQRTVNQGYFGLGNASPAQRPSSATGEPGRYFQCVLDELRVFQSSRIVLRRPVSVALATVYRYMDATAYPGSQLAVDAAATTADGQPLIRGVGPMHYVELSARLILDTRDGEIMPMRGVFHQVWLRAVQGFPTDASIAYGAAGASLSQYVHLVGPLVFASRVFGEMQFGNVPFYDLFRAGTPFAFDAPGGAEGVRGVPYGRYAGPIKLVVNLELRALLLGFRAFGQSLRLGANAFFDTGRLWSDYTTRSPRDGAGPGFTFGTGVGLYLRWGQAALFRAEIAYSPDATAENPGFPFGIYIEDGVMF